MNKQLWIWILCLSLLSLTSCAIFQNNKGSQKALCKEIKRRIIFNGATTNTALAQQQRAEMGTLAQSYRREGCE